MVPICGCSKRLQLIHSVCPDRREAALGDLYLLPWRIALIANLRRSRLTAFLTLLNLFGSTRLRFTSRMARGEEFILTDGGFSGCHYFFSGLLSLPVAGGGEDLPFSMVLDRFSSGCAPPVIDRARPPVPDGLPGL